MLPEDKADADIATGFSLHPQLSNERSIQVLPPAGGWIAVAEKFRRDHVSKMRLYSDRRMVLLIDFDKRDIGNRFEFINQQIPDDLKDRVFILGVADEPEILQKSLGKSLELIGETLATNCSNNTYGLWEHDLLKHNKTELERMISSVRPFLFN
ncbi:hypothetical protein [Trichothermofontia sp.]